MLTRADVSRIVDAVLRSLPHQFRSIAMPTDDAHDDHEHESLADDPMDPPPDLLHVSQSTKCTPFPRPAKPPYMASHKPTGAAIPLILPNLAEKLNLVPLLK